jgi:hypothetical protein
MGQLGKIRIFVRNPQHEARHNQRKYDNGDFEHGNLPSKIYVALRLMPVQVIAYFQDRPE